MHGGELVSLHRRRMSATAGKRRHQVFICTDQCSVLYYEGGEREQRARGRERQREKESRERVKKSRERRGGREREVYPFTGMDYWNGILE